MNVYHDSHDLRDRKPFGAVPVGTEIELGLSVTDPAPGTNCFVRLWDKDAGASRLPMTCVSWGQTARFTATVTAPAHGCLLWYFFIVESYGGSRLYYGNNDEGLGGAGVLRDSSPKSFQITVYEPSVTPDWYKYGIAYQIFPDRFFRGKDWLQRQADAQRPNGWKGAKRLLQWNWEDTPFYMRGENGEIERWPFFGGTLEGVREKLMYLKSLGVTAIYLNPIFEGSSNHKYDTGDYMRVDPALGDEESFEALTRAAGELGIHVILDGVFSHTGSDSRYFNQLGNYDTVGACQGPESPYYKWYRFKRFPDEYECWWGVTNLPNVEELEPSYSAFIHGDKDSVIRHWLNKGASGWRLDVADELPDEFIRGIRRAMDETKEDSVLLGEVWEDASNKESYGQPREYLLGRELHSTMNYPFRTAAIDFMLGRLSPEGFRARLKSLQENYPPENFYGALNVIGSHDRQRILTTLGDAPDEKSLDERQRERFRLSADKYDLARRRLKMLSLIQFTMPGVPCIYYGDEAGVQGYADPYNRAPYPWGHEDWNILRHYRAMATLRQQYPVLARGGYEPQAFGDHVYGCRRWDGEDTIQVLVNRGIFEHEKVRIKMEEPNALELLSAKWLEPDEDGMLTVELEPLSGVAIQFVHTRPAPAKCGRSAGVVCHLTAIPGRDGKATLSDGKAFVDFLAKAGQKLWQVLPLNPVGFGGSPYSSPAAFAGETSLIDRKKRPAATGYESFCKKNSWWLEDYALYASIKAARKGLPWQKWPKAERDRTDLEALRETYAEAMEEHRRDQYWFWSQWAQLKEYANQKGVRIIGDVPLGVADDSADVWANRSLFELDEQGYAKRDSGAPPDYFNPDGQDWGNPVYDWEELARTGYDWWLRRLGWAKECFDYVRLDHFRGYSEYYSIPRGESGRSGGWRNGPGIALFNAAQARLGLLPILAEDLGDLDAGVYRLLALTGFPGMDVYQFTAEKMLKMEPEKAAGRVFYGSTHDSQTLAAWCAENGKEPAEAQRELYASDGGWVMLQLQDLLGLGDEARYNTPGTVGEHNWSWQALPGQLTDEIAERYRSLAEETGRSGPAGA